MKLFQFKTSTWKQTCKFWFYIDSDFQWVKSKWTVIKRLNNKKTVDSSRPMCTCINIWGTKDHCINFSNYNVSQQPVSFSSVSCGDLYHVICVIVEDRKIVAWRKTTVACSQWHADLSMCIAVSMVLAVLYSFPVCASETSHSANE